MGLLNKEFKPAYTKVTHGERLQIGRITKQTSTSSNITATSYELICKTL